MLKKRENSNAQQTVAFDGLADIVKEFKEAWGRLMSRLFGDPISFQTFMDETGTFFDELILECQKEKQLAYKGGVLTLTLPSAREIILKAEMFYQNQDEEWIKQEFTNRLSKDFFNDWESSQYLQQLSADKKLELDIDPPKVETCANSCCENGNNT